MLNQQFYFQPKITIMKSRLLITLFIITLCTAGLSSCAEEEITPKELTTRGKQLGGQAQDKGSWD